MFRSIYLWCIQVDLGRATIPQCLKSYIAGYDTIMPLKDFAYGGCAGAQLHFQILKDKSGTKSNPPEVTIID